MAESFGVDAERYDRTRPHYPDAMVTALVATAPGPDALDVGCGTGIEARQLQAAGWRVLGLDPDERMAAFARGTGVDVEVATFEDWDPRGRDFDAVIAATAWHWVDPVAGAAKAARILRPDGLLALIWNVGQPPSVVGRAFATACERMVPDLPGTLNAERPAVELYQAMFDKAADGIRATPDLSKPRQERWDWQQDYTREQWLDVLPTQGLLTRLAPEPLAEVLAEVGAAIDSLGGGFTMDYATVAVTATRTAAG